MPGGNVQVRSMDIYPLMNEASRKAAAAREAGDDAEYRLQKQRLEALSALYRGFGSAEDMLELEKARRQEAPLVQVANIAKYIGFAAGALLLYPILTQMGRGRR